MRPDVEAGPLRELEIAGVFFASASRFSDKRGWLIETWRDDWLVTDELRLAAPAMSYVSLTRPGVARGPHEHKDQVDWFGFVGPSNFRVLLWDNRPESATAGVRITMTLGEDSPGVLVVPPGVTHAYKNVGRRDGLVLNYPNRLYAGRGKLDPVDEIRHEDDPASRFSLDE